MHEEKLRPEGVDPKKAALIFVHVPKTAGTTLNRLIEWEYDPTRIFTVEGTLVRWSLARFKNMSEKRRRGLRVVKGHMYYGLHKWLPQTATYLTVLRDPVERMISMYYYIMTSRFHPLKRKTRGVATNLAEFVERTSLRANVQTKILAGLDIDEACDERHLEIALRNLETDFAVVGLTERFPESLALMKLRFGWRFPFYSSFRKTRQRPDRQEVDPGTLALIQERNALDRRLYEYAAARFEQEIAVNRAKVDPILEGFEVNRPPTGLAGKWHLAKRPPAWRSARFARRFEAWPAGQ